MFDYGVLRLRKYIACPVIKTDLIFIVILYEKSLKLQSSLIDSKINTGLVSIRNYLINLGIRLTMVFD